MILDYDAKPRDELKLKPEPNIRVLVDLETLTPEELDFNSIVAYNVAEYDVINQVLLFNKSSPSLEPF